MNEQNLIKKAGPGRKKGSKNKLPLMLAQMAEQALKDAGGHEYLRAVAKTHPAAFLAFLGKFVPRDVHLLGDADNPVLIHTIRNIIVDPKQRQVIEHEKSDGL